MASMFDHHGHDNVVSILSARTLRHPVPLQPMIVSDPDCVDGIQSFAITDYIEGEIPFSFDEFIDHLRDQGISAERVFVTLDNEKLIVAND